MFNNHRALPSKREFLHQLIVKLSSPTTHEEVDRNLYNFSQIFAPEFLYRYRECGRPHSFSDVENCQVTLTAASEFDDLDDTAIHDAGTMDRMANIMADSAEETLTILRNISESLDGLRTPSTLDQMLALAERLYSTPEDERKRTMDRMTKAIRSCIDTAQFSESLREQEKITCFCENADSDYMWDNYGGGGSGYLIEYRTRDLYKIALQDKKIPLILPVIYTDALPDTFLLVVSLAFSTPLSEAMGNTLRGLQDIGLVKCVFYKQSNPFENEEEWRMMLAPEEDKLKAKHVFRQIKASRLIAGRNMKDEDRLRLLECVNTHEITCVAQRE